MSSEKTEIVNAEVVSLPSKIDKKSVELALTHPSYIARLNGLFGSEKRAEQFRCCVLNNLAKNPKLRDCTPRSFFDTLNKAAEYNLMPDNRTCALVPVKNKRTGTIDAQMRLMYQGYVELFSRNGILVKATEVCEKDFYEETNEQIVHRINRWAEFKEKGGRGQIYGIVAHAIMPDGRVKSEFIAMKYIDKVRGYAQTQNIWEADWLEMAKKTAIRYIAKTLPQTSELKWAIESDDKASVDFSIRDQRKESFTASQIDSDDYVGDSGKEGE